MAQAFQDAPLTADQTKAAAFVDTPLEAPRSAAMDARRSGFGASDRTDEQPSGIAQWFETKLRPLLEQVAHPQTISDIAALLVPDQGLTASVRAGARAGVSIGRGTAAVGRGVETAATSPAAQHIADVGAVGELMRGDLKGAAVSYLAPKAAAIAGRGLQKGGAAVERALTEAPAVERPAAPIPVAPVVDEFTAARAAKVNTLPDQKALNETALAARRLAYQASQQTTPAPIVKASGKMHFTAAEMKEFARLRTRGLSLADAQAAVTTAKGLAAKLGGATDAEVAAAVAHRAATGAW